jgi:hypothetical protein
MKRVLLPLLAAFVTMLVIAAVAGGHGSKAHRSLQLVGTEASFNFVDADPKQANPETEPPSPGDSFLISEALTKHGQTFGNLYIHCTFVVDDTTQCLATFDLPNGQITTQGVLHQGDFQDVADFIQAVTGGTGDYARAGGTVHVQDALQEGVPSHYEIQLR